MDTTRSVGMSTSMDMSMVCGGVSRGDLDKSDGKEEGQFSLFISSLRSLRLLNYFVDHAVVDVIQMKVR